VDIFTVELIIVSYAPNCHDSMNISKMQANAIAATVNSVRLVFRQILRHAILNSMDMICSLLYLNLTLTRFWIKIKSKITITSKRSDGNIYLLKSFNADTEKSLDGRVSLNSSSR